MSQSLYADSNNENESGIIINGEMLKQVSNAKYLGVLLDDKLNWSNQINAVSLKLSKGVGLLAKSRHYVPNIVSRSLYFSFINSYTDYNLLKALRILSFKDSDHPSAPLFKDHKILPLSKSIDLKYSKHMWKLINGFLPNCLASNFRPTQRTQYSNAISRLESLSRSVYFAGPQLWNHLPANIRDRPSLNAFSNTAKEYFLESL